LTSRGYIPYSAFPGKALRLYDDLRTVQEREQTAAGERPGPIDGA
jgi:ATP-dependent Clp protease ATP-binding subunit ClpC